MEAPISPDATAAIAHSLVAARLDWRALPAYPGAMPQTMAQAYAIQDAAIGLWPDRVAGWKVGRIPEPVQAQHGGRRKLAGPVFGRAVLRHPASFPAIHGGLCAIEGELILRMGQDIAPGALPDRSGLSTAIAGVFAGIEMASSPYAGMNDHGPAVTASDFGVNGAVILGQELPRVPALDGQFQCTVSIDGVVQGSRGFGDTLGDPVAILAELLEILSERGIGLKGGDLVSTGAITGVHAMTPGQAGQAVFDVAGQRAEVDVVVV